MLDQSIERWNQLAGSWADWMWASLFGTTVVLAAVSLLWFCIRRSSSPQLGYLLFLLVPLKLFVPFEIALPERLSSWLPLSISTAPEISPTSDSIESRSVATLREVTPTSPSFPEEKSAVPANDVVTIERSDRSTARLAETPSAPAVAETSPVMPVLQRPAVSVFGWLMCAWLVGAFALLARLIRAQFSFHRVLGAAKRVAPEQLTVDFAELLKRSRVSRRVRIVETSALATPAVWGIFRPTLILPTGIVSSLSAPQLEWVLLHELAHIRRCDLVTNFLQRLATIAQFPNPAIWVGNRVINRLREYACDDIALALGRTSQVESSEAFMGVIRFAASMHHRPKSVDGAIGVFGASAKASCFERMRRLLDTERRVRVKLGLGSLCVLLLAAVLALPQVRSADPAAESETPQSAEPQPNSSSALVEVQDAKKESPANPSSRFELLVVGPDGKPVPNAEVEVRVRPSPAQWSFHSGTVVEGAGRSPVVRVGNDGKLSFDLTREGLELLRLYIYADGYGPFYARWETSESSTPIPAQLTANLDAGRSVGGIIVDDAGKPVSGVEIHPHIKFKTPKGDDRALHVGTQLKTDAEGRWSYHNVPMEMKTLHISSSSPNQNWMPLSKTYRIEEIALGPGEAPRLRLALERGLVVTGTIKDEAGKPIFGATVRTTFLNDQKETTTNADGVFRLEGCKPVRTSIVATAPGRAPELANVQIEANMSPVDFTLGPGRTIRVHVVDKEGRPIPESRIFFKSWRGDAHSYELGTVHSYTNDEGIWEWREAPADAVICSIYAPEHMEIEKQELVARDEEYLFKPSPELVISGRVIDAQTQKPIERFRVVPGVRFSRDSTGWLREDGFDSANGAYRIRHYSYRLAHMVRIEVEGYQAANSREVKSDEGSVTIDFELKRGKNVAAQVITPDGKAAAGADVALGFPKSQIRIQNGVFTDSTYCDRATADKLGHFQFPPQDAPFQLIVLHPSGFANLPGDPSNPPAQIKLRPWARVEGTLKTGSVGGAGLDVGLDTSGGAAEGSIATNVSVGNELKTDGAGRFLFERVFPGEGRIARKVTYNRTQRGNTVTSSHSQLLMLVEGKTTPVTLGGTGRAVTGQFVAPTGNSNEVDWNFSLVSVTPKLPELSPLPTPEDIKGDNKKIAAWWQEWSKTDAGRAWRKQQQEYETARLTSTAYQTIVGENGRFRLDDVPAGEYTLSIDLSTVPDDGLADSGNQIGHLERSLTIPAMDGGRSDEALDLGTLTLEGAQDR